MILAIHCLPAAVHAARCGSLLASLLGAIQCGSKPSSSLSKKQPDVRAPPSDLFRLPISLRSSFVPRLDCLLEGVFAELGHHARQQTYLLRRTRHGGMAAKLAPQRSRDDTRTLPCATSAAAGLVAGPRAGCAGRECRIARSVPAAGATHRLQDQEHQLLGGLDQSLPNSATASARGWLCARPQARTGTASGCPALLCLLLLQCSAHAPHDLVPPMCPCTSLSSDCLHPHPAPITCVL